MGSGDRFEERTDYLNTTENILPQENISLTLCQLGYHIRGTYERIAMKVRLRRPCQYLTFYFAYVPAKTTHQDARLTSVLTGLGKGFPMMNPK